MNQQERKLNQGQLNVLMKLYKFRFSSRELVADSLGKKNSTTIYSKLDILVKHGYVAKHFEPNYKLEGRPAEYYLLPKALRYLIEHNPPDGLDDKTIKNSYKDKQASTAFIKHCLNIYALHNQLVKLYNDLQFFTRRELTIYDYFPSQLPDGFLSIKVDGQTRRFFLELIATETPPFAVDRRLRQLVEYHENDDWSVTDLPFPAILCVCETGAVERRFRKQVTRLSYRSDTDILLYTTTKPALLSSQQGDDAIWSNVTEPEVLHSIKTLIVNP